jgi:Tfp pilus assembly protein PilF
VEGEFVKGDAEKGIGQCLTDETLTGYLEDALEPVVKAACEVHLISCDKCRRELAVFMRVLRADITPDEEETVRAISAAWESRKGGVLPPRERKTGTRGLFSLLGVVAVLASVVFVSMRMSGNGPAMPQSGGEIVRALLSQSRPFEGRLADEPHHPLIQTRSSSSANFDYELLAREMSRLGSAPYEMGRFYLVQQEFDSAIRNLEIAVQNSTSSPETLNDLGVAYMERGGDGNLAKAVEEFQRALKQNANFAPAVFNLSLVYERMGALPDAAALWRRYLELDTTSGWATEIRSKIQGMNQ